MNYFEKQEREQRSEPRRMLRCKATIVTRAHGTLRGDTIDISSRGISIMSPLPIPVATPVGITFQVWLGNDLLQVAMNAVVVNEVCVGTKGFRTGFEMRDMDEASKAAVKRLTAVPV